VTTAPIVLNCRVAVRPTITGVERWTLEVSRRLHALDPERYLIARPAAWAHSGPAGHAWEQFALPTLALRHRATTIFSPANLAPLAWPGNVIVVHDAAVLRQPAAYSRSYRAWHKEIGLTAARRARAVVTVSEFSRRELIELGGLDPGRLTVIGGGVDARFTPGDGGGATAALGLHRPYVLTIATDDPRKNLDALLPCAAALAQRGIELVWAGDSRPQFARTKPLTGLRELGYVPDELLVGLYRGAEAFVLPSRYEGFGLTCLEAMACGTPVIAADRGALPEVCGDAALLVDPDDPRAIAHAVLTVCEDRPRAARLRAAGVERARLYSWDRVATGCDALLSASESGGRRPTTREPSGRSSSPGSARRPGTPPELPPPRGRAAAG
jgi:glycosyltransferase involved in cell wall biosynthesis